LQESFYPFIKMKEIKLTTKIHVYPLEESSEIEKKLIMSAKKASLHAYAPYSKFHVGAAVLLEGGEIVWGNNQENAAYPSGLCAERTTVFAANATHPDKAVEAIAIAASVNGQFTEAPVTPCGSCRQVLLETQNRFGRPIKVLMYGGGQIYAVDSIKDILPLSFGEEMLKA
jgi:cytidine deaminase